MNTLLLVGSNGLLLQHNNLGTLLIDYLFTMTLLFRMLRTKVTEIYLPLLDQEMVEFMHSLPTHILIWSELAMQMSSNLLNTDPKSLNGTSFISDILEKTEELMVMFNLKEEKKSLISHQQTTMLLNTSTYTLLKINSTLLIVED